MEVEKGLATDYGQRRFTITLTEADLERLLRQHAPGQQISALDLPEETAYSLLDLEAERYELVQSPKFGEPQESAEARLRANRVQFATQWAAVKGTAVEVEMKRLGL